ncbi:hypothetical protein HFO56_33100 [Rhizobium laguerreae]|uniref:hypothetical protein n=1 Tax=Rhizobium laguerreae TaxID=1076926 RepID=UPI001C924DDF|nr:hypothetical protein [Rhizobium laguerreae]MBY3157163.1 hypothetical protein [Rhizobium laguerreae]
MSQRITTTSLVRLREIGTPAERSLPRVQEVMRRALQDSVGLVLAEPIPRSDGRGIDWYTEHEEPLTRLNSLPPEQADYYRGRLRADIATMSAATAEYEARGDKAARATASALRAAMTYPGDDHVWLAGDIASGKVDIILTSWGYDTNVDTPPLPPDIQKPGVSIVEPGNGAGAGGPDLPPVQATLRPSDWRRGVASFLWLLALLLPLAIGWLLIPACGVRVPFTDRYVFGRGDGSYCRQLPNPQQVAGRGETERLTTEVAAVSDQVRTKIAECVPPAPATPPEDVARLPDGTTIDPNETSVSLTWNNSNDLDLYIVCPDGNRVPLEGFRCGFKHEVDMNRGGDGAGLVSNPVEYIRRQSNSLAPGTYKVEVVYFAKNDPTPDPTDFVVTVRQDGRTPQQIPGSTSTRVPPQPRDKKEVIPVTEFTVQ